MNPAELSTFLATLVRHQVKLSTMIWGPPGIGKSSIVAQTAAAHGLACVDLRLSQLAPTDLRGLPVAHDGRAHWYPPEFLPSDGAGVLFLDEINLAPPTMQGMAQQLVLDRRVGSYCYDDQTRVMTRRGLKFFRQLTDDDELMTLNPDTKQVEYHTLLCRIERPYKGEMLHFSGKGISLCVSPEHRMYVRARHKQEFEFIPAGELAQKRWWRYHVKRNGDWVGHAAAQISVPPSQRARQLIAVYDKVLDLRQAGLGPKAISQQTGLHIRRVEKYLYFGANPRNSFRMDNIFSMRDWAEFIGWYVTEGSISRAHNWRIHIAQDKARNPENYARIAALLGRMGIHARQAKTDFLILSAALYELLAPLGKAREKHVPSEVKNLPRACLEVLLEAMLLGDGDGKRKFFTSSERLRDDFCEIAIKLGYGVSFSKQTPSGYTPADSIIWVVYIGDTNVEHRISQLDHIPYDGTIYCVTVPNHIIMVERDGRLSWCGNCVPEGWYIWAAGNRQEDSAAVFEMPAPVANRFLHVDVAPDLESFKAYALECGVHEQIVAFLAFRPLLLHRFDAAQPAWPSPRSWVMASELHRLGLDVRAAVGAAASAEFNAYVAVYQHLPDLDAILSGAGDGIAFPEEPSIRYATTVGLTARAADAQMAFHAFRWLTQVASAEWVQLCAVDLFRLMRARGQMRALRTQIAADSALQDWLAAHQRLLEL